MSRASSRTVLDSENSRHLVLQCHLAVGDIVMLTAAVRDLHRAYPGRFLTSVYTSCPEIWTANPLITPFGPDCLRGRRIECHYPLINQAHRDTRHCLHGFIEYLNDELSLKIRLTELRGDIRLGQTEKRRGSQISEVLGGEEIPYWIVAAGGKFDLTTKWWGHERYQKVIDAFRGRIQFVQIGHADHWHPKLDGAIDLRGKTDLRQLIQLVHHSQGVLCPVTGLMHLAAAVEQPGGNSMSRPCVVLAGGREPPHWEEYPGHRFLHTIGDLDCCRETGCWKARTQVLGDGDERDAEERLCREVDRDTPRCLTLIQPEQVVEAIESYFEGGRLDYLNHSQRLKGWQAVDATTDSEFDRRPLKLNRSRLEVQRRLAMPIESPLGNYQHQRGIVICAGGSRQCARAFLVVSRLRELGCELPIEWWSFRAEHIEIELQQRLEAMGVVFRNARSVEKLISCRRLGSLRALEFYALSYGTFRENLVLDLNCLPLVDPTGLFDDLDYQKEGRSFWAESGISVQGARVRMALGLKAMQGQQLLSAAFLVDGERHRQFIQLVRWFMENGDFFAEHLDHAGILHATAELTGKVIQPIEGMVQDTLEGQRILSSEGREVFDYRSRNRLPLDLMEAEGAPDWVLRGIGEIGSLWRGDLTVQDDLKRQLGQHKLTRPNTLWHLQWSVPTEVPAERRRLGEAKQQWQAQYQQAQWVPFNLAIEDCPRLFQSGSQVEPYLEDLIEVAFPQMRDGDIIVVTTPGVFPLPTLTKHLIDSVPAMDVLYEMGVKADKAVDVNDVGQLEKGERVPRCRIFACKKSWWERNRDQTRDFLLRLGRFGSGERSEVLEPWSDHSNRKPFVYTTS